MFRYHSGSNCPQCEQKCKKFKYNSLFLYTDTVYYQCNDCDIVFSEKSEDRFYAVETNQGIANLWPCLSWFIAQDDVRAMRDVTAEIPEFRKLHRLNEPTDNWEENIRYTIDLRDYYREEEIEVEEVYNENLWDESLIRSA